MKMVLGFGKSENCTSIYLVDKGMILRAASFYPNGHFEEVFQDIVGDNKIFEKMLSEHPTMVELNVLKIHSVGLTDEEGLVEEDRKEDEEEDFI